jgi:hypothetical protein
MRRAVLLGMIVAMVTTAVPAVAGDWVVARQGSSGICAVQLETSRPIFGNEIAKKPTQDAACQEAKARKTDNPADTKKCFDYLPATKSLCKIP